MDQQGDLGAAAKRAWMLDEDNRFRAILEDAAVASLGRFLVTRQARDIGKFRTPSLRNVAITAPYMHDGSVATLEEALERELYYRGLSGDRPIILTPDEKRAIVAFLRALTDADFVSAGSARSGRSSGTH
jgi:cytochrome c peroxidase